MKKWIALIVALVALLLGYVAAGPYLAIRGIHASLQARDTARLERYVDFPVLRGNVQAQLEDRMARAAGELGGGLLGDLARGAVAQLGGAAVQTMVTPQGIAMLLEGRSLTKRVTDPFSAPEPAPSEGGAQAPTGYRPLDKAQTRFESASRFVAVTQDSDGRTGMTFVFERQGLRWRLTDIRLPD
jgi:hypothetical protein